MDTADLLMLADYPSHHRARTPDRKALIFGDHSWTYAELDEACDRIVALVAAEGVSAGDRLAYVGRNTDLFYLVEIAAARMGAILAPLNWRNTAREHRFQIEDSQCRLVFSDVEFAPVLREAAAEAGIDMPVTEAVCALLEGAPVGDVIGALLSRPLRDERE